MVAMASTPPPGRGPRRPEHNGDGDRRELGGRVQRASNLARLSASTSAGYLSSRVRGLRKGDLADQRFHTETATKMLEMLGSMKGAAMKLGQIASFVDLDLPPEVQATYHEVLADLRDAAPPTDPEVIAQVIADEFGAPPQDVFAEWKPEPLASASIGQVHWARLHDGSEVVAKVQYPGVAEAVESDLANAELFTPFAKLISPNLKVKPLIEELRARVIDELDYQREAQYQQAFFERYDGHPFIRVPRVFADYSRPRILTAEYVDGRSFDQMQRTSSGDEQRRYGEIIYRFVFGSLNRFRLFNADPHPGNYLFPDDGSVVFLDFGSVKMFGSATRDAIQRQLRAVIANDLDALLEEMRGAGFLPPNARYDVAKLMQWFRVYNRPILEDAEFSYTPEYARDVIRTTTDPRQGYVDLLRRLNLPPDYLTLNRIQWGVNSILGRLHARANWHRILMEFWETAPPSTELGREERPFIDASPFLA
jgi:predicted unusual protein kinase regulating ubiquinone biosynthesis (AarF/ABC1/UbiB family)